MAKRTGIVLATLGILLIAALALATGWYFMRLNAKARTGPIVGVFLYAQHPVILEIQRGFKEELDRLATERGVSIEYVERNADGDAAQSNAIANFFKAANVDMIFVVGLPAAQALKSAKVQQPVIFGGPPDPVSAGLVPSIANHGTNFTGTRYLPPAERILDVFEQAYPTAKRVAVLHNPGEENSMSVVRVFLDGAQKRQLISLDLGATNALEIESALRALANAKVDGLFLPTDNLVYSSLDRILSQTKALGIPVFNCTKLSVEKGATFSLATDYFKVGSITAEKIAAQILFFGKKPNQLDVIEIEEGSIYVNSNIESSTRIKPIAGYEIVSVQ